MFNFVSCYLSLYNEYISKTFDKTKEYNNKTNYMSDCLCYDNGGVSDMERE